MDLHELRRRNEAQGLDVDMVDDDPMVEFARWYDEVRQSGLYQPDAMSLATVDADGRAAVRHVLLKGVEPAGFVFYTNYTGAKARQLAGNPNAAIVFPWHQIGRQVRASGPVEKVSPEESDEYFATRPRGSQLSAWASDQSTEIENRAYLEDRLAAADARFAGRAVDRPPHWGGYRLVPDEVELWQGRPDRLHDRVLYRRERNGSGWKRCRLSP